MRLFDQIEVKMTDWVMQALKVDRARADRLRAALLATYGTTLAGLMREHDVDPGPYLTEVHDIDFSVLSPDPALAPASRPSRPQDRLYQRLRALCRESPCRRGLAGLFDAIYGVEHAAFHPKPDRRPLPPSSPRTGSTRPAPRCSRMTPQPGRPACAGDADRPCRPEAEPAPTTSTTTPTTCRLSAAPLG
jgi:putative hydrolase of the HAD superfamily